MDVGTTAVPPTSFPVAKEESRESVDTRDTEEERIRLEIAELPDLKNRVLMRRFCDAAYAGDMFQLKRIAEELPEEVCRGRDPDDKVRILLYRLYLTIVLARVDCTALRCVEGPCRCP